jgi:hypothetical protein
LGGINSSVKMGKEVKIVKGVKLVKRKELPF